MAGPVAGPAQMCRWRRACPASPTTSRWHIAWAGWTPPAMWHAAGQGKQFDPALSEVISDEGEMILSGLDDVGTWDAVIDAEPALAVAVGPDQLDEALRAVANFVDLKSPYSLGHAGAVADLAGDAGRRLGMSEGDATTLRRAGLVHGLGRLGISNAIWDKPTAAGRRRVGAGAPPSLPDRAHAAAVAVAGAAGCDRRAAARAAGRLRLPARPVRRRDLATGPGAGRGRRLPGDARAPPLPPAAAGRPGRRRAARRGQGRPAGRRGGGRRAGRRRPPHSAAAAAGRPA